MAAAIDYQADRRCGDRGHRQGQQLAGATGRRTITARSSSRAITYDPERAKTLLAEAGYKGEKIDLIANKRSTVPSFNTAVIAQAMMQAVGINVEIEVLDWAAQLDRYNTGATTRWSPSSYSARLDPALELRADLRPEGQAAAQGLGEPGGAGADRQGDAGHRPEASGSRSSTSCTSCCIEDVPVIFTYNGNRLPGAHNKRIRACKPWASKPRLWDVASRADRPRLRSREDPMLRFAADARGRWRSRHC